MGIRILLSVATLLTAAPVFAAGPADVIPEDVGVVLRLTAPNKTFPTVAALANKIDKQAGLVVAAGRAGLGVVISNPTLKGVDQDRDWWVAVFPTADGEPGVVFAIPTTDADAMKDVVAEAGMTHTVKHEKYLFYTSDERSSKLIAKCASGDSPAIKLDDKSQRIFGSGQLALHVNVKQLTTTYKTQIDQGVQQVEDMLGTLPLPPEQGIDIEAVFDVYIDGLKALVAAARDSETAVGSVNIGEDAVVINEFVRIPADTGTARVLAKHKPSKHEMLSRMPGGETMYFGISMDMQELMKHSLKFMSKMLKKDNDQEMDALLKKFRQVTYGDMAASLRLGDSNAGILQMTTGVGVKPVEKARELAAETSKITQQFEMPGVKTEVKVEPNAESFGDRKADIIRVKQTFDPNADPLGIQKEVNKRMYGPEGMVTRVVAVDDALVQTIGGGRASMERSLKAWAAKSADATAAKTNNQLLPESNVTVLMDIPDMLSAMLGFAIEAGAPIPVDNDTIKQIKGKRSYLGVSVGVDPDGLRAKTAVPVEQIKGVYNFAKTVRDISRNPGI